MMDADAGGARVLLRKALVLGRGPLAEAMRADLAGCCDVSVTLADAPRPAELDSLGPLGADFDVVLSAVAAPEGAGVLRAVIQARGLIADVFTPLEEALALDGLARSQETAACVGCGRSGLARLLGQPGPAPDPHPAQASEARLAALMATALARRLMTGDFRGHWGVWTPERLRARAGMAHGILQDLRERGVLPGPA